MTIIKLHDESRFAEVQPHQFFENQDEVAGVLLQCLIDNDSEAFMEILDSYLRVN